jgi:hypothetical protein
MPSDAVWGTLRDRLHEERIVVPPARVAPSKPLC